MFYPSRLHADNQHGAWRVSATSCKDFAEPQARFLRACREQLPPKMMRRCSAEV